MKGMTTVMSSGKDDWQTPAEILELVRKVAPIGLDPCPGKGSLINAEVECVDGTTEDWSGHGLVYVNPPYSDLLQWAKLCCYWGTQGLVDTEIISLTPARTDTKAFQEFMSTADTMCFIKGRLKFKDPSGAKTLYPAPFPTLACYWGENEDLFCDAFGKRGVLR